ncbi:MAG: LysM peptidoglycan-binding domain-containing protein [Ruminococcaceae bacterium]|nr:LysM peptidoglycan-binding domain-containing protein [Oscillospiraceae bacterium]
MEPITYTVRPGNTLFAIAQLYGTTPIDIARYNGIVYPYTIYPGQVLRIPVKDVTPPMYYFVRPGDTLYSIANRYGIDIKTLVAINALEDPNTIYPGQRLVLYV